MLKSICEEGLRSNIAFPFIEMLLKVVFKIFIVIFEVAVGTLIKPDFKQLSLMP